MIDKVSIGQRIKQARQDKGINSQEALAEEIRKTAKSLGRGNSLASLKRQTIQNWESGKIVPPWDKVELLAKVLGEEHSEEWIMFGPRRTKQIKDETPLLVYLTMDEAQLVNDYRHSNEPGRKSILSNAKAISKDFPAEMAGVHLMRRSTDPQKK